MTTPQNRRAPWTAAKILLGLASVGAGYLLITKLTNGPLAGCGEGSSCDVVLSSRFAYLLPGVPVAAPALFTYLALLFGLCFKPDSKAWEGIFLVGSLMIIGAAIWFTGLQMIKIKALCLWCMGTHVTAVAGSVCILLGLRPIARELIPIGAGGAAMALAMLAACQFFLPQKTTVDTQLGAAGLSGRGKIVTIGGPNGIKLNIDQMPYRGNPDSDKRMLVLFDYTCSSCRRVHGYLKRAEERFGKDNYLVVMVPTPLNPDCNRYFTGNAPDHRNACLFASMAFALWSADREKFYEYDRWLIETGSDRYPPDAATTRAKAEELLGKDELAAALSDPQITAKLEEASKIWNLLKMQTGNNAMPKMLWNDGAMKEGAVSSEFGLFETMEQHLGVVRVN